MNLCGCGCGAEVAPSRQYLRGHARRGKPHTEETRKRIADTKRIDRGRPPLEPLLCACGCGEYATVDEGRNRQSKYLPGHNTKASHPMAGKHHSDEAKAKLATYSGEKASSYKHGWSRTPTYKTWTSMIGRCEDPRNASYKTYGGRGIVVCERWHDFENFLADMGERPSLDHSIDRIEANGHYEPGNCRWLTRAEQNARRVDPGGWITRRANAVKAQVARSVTIYSTPCGAEVILNGYGTASCDEPEGHNGPHSVWMTRPAPMTAEFHLHGRTAYAGQTCVPDCGGRSPVSVEDQG